MTFMGMPDNEIRRFKFRFSQWRGYIRSLSRREGHWEFLWNDSLKFNRHRPDFCAGGLAF